MEEIVVVTGASGCLGHQTVRLLIGQDDQVREIRCLDLVEPNRDTQQMIEHEQVQVEKRLGHRKLVKFIKGDIRDINIVEQTLQGSDCIIHCAAKIDIWRQPGDQDAQELESVNVQGTENLLRSAIRLGVAKFVHVSSFEVFTSYHTIYYATENTLPEPENLLFGPSAKTKKQAELKVKQYANHKLKQVSRINNKDSLNAIIVRFTPIYGEQDKYFVSKLLEITKFFRGRLQRLTNVWIRQQPIYVGNAAWSLVKAKQRMDIDESISGEEFNITDETKISDPFDFVQPFVECKGMQVSKSSYPALPIWLLLVLFFFMRRCLVSLDVFGLFTRKRTKLQETMERDQQQQQQQRLHQKSDVDNDNKLQKDGPGQQQAVCSQPTKWSDLITPETFFFFVNSLFLNRTKASLRLDYEPLFGPEDAIKRSLDWYKNCLQL